MLILIFERIASTLDSRFWTWKIRRSLCRVAASRFLARRLFLLSSSAAVNSLSGLLCDITDQIGLTIGFTIGMPLEKNADVGFLVHFKKGKEL